MYKSVSHNMHKAVGSLSFTESLKVQLEGFPFASHRLTSRTPSCSGGVAGRALRGIIHGPVTGTAEGSWWTGDEHGDTFAAHATDTLCTGETFVQGPWSFTMCAVNLDFLGAEGCRGGVGKAVVLALGNGRNEIENRTGIRIDGMGHSRGR